MTDLEKKNKYKEIIYKLNTINKKSMNLVKSLSLLENVLEKNLSINDEIYDQDNIKKVSNKLYEVSNNITNQIIPEITKKIYE